MAATGDCAADVQPRAATIHFADLQQITTRAVLRKIYPAAVISIEYEKTLPIQRESSSSREEKERRHTLFALQQYTIIINNIIIKIPEANIVCNYVKKKKKKKRIELDPLPGPVERSEKSRLRAVSNMTRKSVIVEQMKRKKMNKLHISTRSGCMRFV
jgi:hypothetical protein